MNGYPPPQPPLAPPVVAEQSRGSVVRSWWILFTLVPFGWFAFAAFGYAGLKADEPRWKRWAVAYLAIFWVATIIASVEELPYGVRQAGGMVMFFGWPIPVIHALVINHAFLARTRPAAPTGPTLPATPSPYPPTMAPPPVGPHAAQSTQPAGLGSAPTTSRKPRGRLITGWYLLFVGVVNILLGIFKYDFQPISIIFGLAAAGAAVLVLSRK